MGKGVDHMIVLGIIIAGLAAYLVYALVYPEKL